MAENRKKLSMTSLALKNAQNKSSINSARLNYGRLIQTKRNSARDLKDRRMSNPPALAAAKDDQKPADKVFQKVDQIFYRPKKKTSFTPVPGSPIV